MDLRRSEEQELLRATVAEILAAESSPERVRAAEPLGFDAALWKHLAAAGILGMRVAGGGAASLLDAALVAEELGRRLASGPVVEAIVAARLLESAAHDVARAWRERALEGSAVVSLALRDAEGREQLVPGGAVADAVVGIDGGTLVLVERAPERASGRAAPIANLASAPLAPWTLGASAAKRTVLADGARAAALFSAALEEWKLLAAAALGGLAREALEMAARYASERLQFDRPIATFQGIAHPLAESAAEVDGARLLVLRAIWAIARGRADAAALVSMSFWWASQAATTSVARALHTHGGYGLSLEYDVQLYHRRGKAWALIAGDPEEELLRAAARLWDEGSAPLALPDPGDVSIDWDLGEKAEALAEEVRRFFAEHLTPELRAKAHYGWEGHDVGVQRKLARAGLLFPAWPEEYGGQSRGPYEMKALQETFTEVGWTRNAIGVTNIVGQTLMRFASEELKAKVLPRFAAGEAIACLGYTEPESGSDVAAAKTRAVRDGDDWIVNGQKMFTSGADLAQYVFLLVRTDPEAAPKHRGLTLFLVPLDLPGIDVQPVHTLSDERTNVTYYADVRVPDRYRVGATNGGWAVMGYALQLEHGASFHLEQRQMLEGAVAWARSARRDGRPAIDSERVRVRLARAATHAEVSLVLARRALWAAAEGIATDPAAGPMGKLFSAEAFIRDAADLMDLAAPDSLFPGRDGASAIESAYRLAAATSIYGGTSEIMRSIVAQGSLGMPRSRS